jgi:ribonucleoside-diphosphate reductase alpha chain
MSQLELSENARAVLEARYLVRDDGGRLVETPDEMFRRVANNISGRGDRSFSSRWKDEFLKMMRELDFLPNSPTLMNAGTGLQQLSACFVLPVQDSIESIYDAVKWSAIIHQSGGGTGFSFSQLRPAGDVVRSTGGIASGPISFMRVFDSATEAVKQGGRRRGASMGILSVDHPDIIDFIHAKDDLQSLQNFNISVAVTDDFMERARKGEDHQLINPRTGKVVGTRNARHTLEEISRCSWTSGDPGLIYIDEVNRGNPAPRMGELRATNPCGEVPLLPFEACVLGSINLANLVHDGEVDWTRLEELTRLGVRFLDSTIDASRFPLPQTEEVVMGNRKIGLGVMGFADCLIQCGIPYGSDDSIKLAGAIIRLMERVAKEESSELAEELGDFPNIDMSEVSGPRRNLTLLSIAPTGTISIIAGCSSGIEPMYAISYARHVMGDTHISEVNHSFANMLRERGAYSKDLMDRVSRRHSIKDISEIPMDIRELFLTAHDVPPERQIRLQSVFQEHVDNAVSKTINLPRSISVEEVMDVFQLAHDLGCKGITVYREGSKPGQVLTVEEHATCPICGAPVRGEEGGFTCRACGHTL